MSAKTWTNCDKTLQDSGNSRVSLGNYHFTMDNAPATARSRPRANSQPQPSRESSSARTLEMRNFATESHEPIPTTATTRHVHPFLAHTSVVHPTVFKDVSQAPTLPTTWNCEPQVMTCPKCNRTDLSSPESRISGTNFFYSGLCFMTAGLCVLSICCPCCMDTVHVCRHCDTEVGYRSAV